MCKFMHDTTLHYSTMCNFFNVSHNIDSFNSCPFVVLIANIIFIKIKRTVIIIIYV